MENPIFEKVLSWCREEDLIRTAILTSSRTRSDGSCDSLSDYDLELYVRNVNYFYKSDTWLEQFGQVLVKWPLKPESTWSPLWVTRLIQFYEGTRIDFQISSQQPVYHETFHAGYKVLIDKDRLCKNLPPPDLDRIKLKKPLSSDLIEILNSFFWDILYVAKALRRDEPYYARYMINLIHNNCLQPLIEWHIGYTRGWEKPINRKGRMFKKYLSEEDWKKVSESMLAGNEEDLWSMMIKMVDLVSYLGKKLTLQQNCPYPQIQEDGIRRYIRQIREYPILCI